ncbi:arabinogalactan peptide 22-like [Sesamum indicum]|uniref:Arabinogalactan peptide 22-like n=1 Tax=Sesamum indicum TaxID=4182 RepID=A0A6I9SSU7_SESIN|nr:arabinogalactan peptide 22-like [Sesamum indicum]
MAMDYRVSWCVFATFVIVYAIFVPAVQGLTPAPAPAPAPTSDAGTAIDQGVAYGLMLLALVLTYLIHTFDTPLNF